MTDWASFLRDREKVYSNGVTRVKRKRISSNDPRLDETLKIPGSMMSGGRFIEDTGYAQIYASCLCHRELERIVLVELGVLLGVGLAVWCDVFPSARVIGLDIDIHRMDMAVLRRRGAFEYNSPTIHFLDELHEDAPRRLHHILRGERIDVMIDDALHDDASILKAMDFALPYMADRFVYFIEDNDSVARMVSRKYPHLNVVSHGRLTVVTNE